MSSPPGLLHGPALPPSAPLPLPTLDRAIPASIIRPRMKNAPHRNPRSVALLCRDLERAGAIRSSDWAGTLPATVEAALRRWVNVECGAGSITSLGLSFVVLDDVEMAMGTGNEWREKHNIPLIKSSWLPKGVEAPETTMQDIFGFAIVAQNFNRFVVGTRIMSLERLCPGAGASVMALLNLSLAKTIGGCTPWWALGECECYDEGEGISEIEEEYEKKEITARERDEKLREMLTSANFLKHTPVIAVHHDWDRRHLERGLEVLGRRGRLSECGARQQATLQAALDLGQHLIRIMDLEWSGRDWNQFDVADQESQCQPCEVRWSEKDWVGRVTDDYAEMSVQMGESDVAWMRAWHHTIPVGSPCEGDCLAAVETTRDLLQIVASIDRLLGLLHYTPPPRRPRRALTLMETLGLNAGPDDDDEFVDTFA